MIPNSPEDWFELCLDKYPDLPSVALIRSIELKHFPRGLVKEPVLDLCCGDGFFTRCLGLKGAHGCDIDAQAIEKARRLKETYASVQICDARELKIFSDNEFNTVFSNCALEHINGIDRALRSIARVLATGGRLIMSVPDENLNRWFFPKVIFSKIGLLGYGRRLCAEYNKKQEHVNIYSFGVWEKKLRDNGLAVEKNFYLFNEKEYKMITFFESFVLDSFPGTPFRLAYSWFKKTMPLEVRKFFWRKLLKKTYLNAGQLDSGGELLIVARKK